MKKGSAKAICLLILASCGGSHAPAPFTPSKPNTEYPPANDLSNNPEEELSFASIQSQILRPNCMECHSTAGRTGGRRIPFDTYEDIIKSDRELIIPGKPERSLIITTTLLNDEDRMPPQTFRAAPLDPELVQKLKLWVQRGAPK